MPKDHEFCDHCPGCKPALIDANTKKVFPADSEIMIKVNKVWNNDTTYEERKAFIQVTSDNSRDSHALALCQQVIAKIQAVLGD